MDVQEFTELIRRHSGLMHKIAYGYCRDASDREEVVQEIAMQLWRSRDRYDRRVKETTWIYRIAVNVAISFHRRERRHRDQRLSLDEAAITIAAPAAEPSDDLRLLLRCIDDLELLDRSLVLLYLEGHDHESISEVLGISASNVGTKLQRLKKKLRAAVDRHARPTGEENP